MAGSQEYRNIQVHSTFKGLLNRSASDAELTGFSQYLASGGSTEQLRAILAGTGEYFSGYGATNDGFLESLYQNGLGRSPGQDGEDLGFVNELNGGLSRTSVATQLFTSPEYLTDQVIDDYQSILGRDAEDSTIVGFTTALQSGLTDEALIAIL